MERNLTFYWLYVRCPNILKLQNLRSNYPMEADPANMPTIGEESKFHSTHQGSSS